MAVFGTSEGFNKFIRGFDQVVSGALSPSVKGVFYWSLLTEFVRNNSIVTCIALMSCKMAAVNMLPLPSFNGGEIVLTLFEMIRPLPAKTREVLNQVGFLISIILFICWLWALLIYI
jgi:membrane-associated protease RseP (regulator of RpoE activity)